MDTTVLFALLIAIASLGNRPTPYHLQLPFKVNTHDYCQSLHNSRLPPVQAHKAQAG